MQSDHQVTLSAVAKSLKSTRISTINPRWTRLL